MAHDAQGADDSALRAGWARWAATFVAVACGLCAALLGFVAVMDPYGVRVRQGEPARPLMDLNQRFMYPQLVRSGAFDSAVIGTSTLRLLDPARLSQGLGGRFVNLGMNAATPWEQVQMARLFAREVASPARLVWGIDLPWCEADATQEAKRLTPRPFPPWLYDGARWLAWPKQLNFTTLEIAVRLAAYRFGLAPERIRGDGYEVFTPPEGTYDLARARFHLYRDHGGRAPDLRPLAQPEPVTPAQQALWRFPALAWLDETLAAFPAQTRVTLVLPPVHAGALPREGSAAWQRFAACKAEIGRVAARHGAIIADYAHRSSLTTVDENYWDPAHYRLPTARRIEDDLVAIGTGQGRPAGDVLRVIAPVR